MPNCEFNDKGYIALISTIVISFVLAALTFSASAAGYAARANTLNREFKRVSLGLAEACANAALLSIAQSPDPAGFEQLPPSSPINVGTGNCIIESIANDGAPGGPARKKIIKVRAEFQHAFSNLEISAIIQSASIAPVPPVPPNVAIVGWREI